MREKPNAPFNTSVFCCMYTVAHIDDKNKYQVDIRTCAHYTGRYISIPRIRVLRFSQMFNKKASKCYAHVMLLVNEEKMK